MNDELKSSTVVRAAQRPATMFWVPLDIFFIECGAIFLLFRFFGLWAAAFLPLHAIPVLLTMKNLFWPRTIRVNFWHYHVVGNRGLRCRGVTFSPARLRTKANSDDLAK